MLYLLSLNCFHEIRKVKSVSRVRLFVTPWTVAYQAPPSMGFSTPVFLPGESQGGEAWWAAVYGVA